MSLVNLKICTNSLFLSVLTAVLKIFYSEVLNTFRYVNHWQFYLIHRISQFEHKYSNSSDLTVWYFIPQIKNAVNLNKSHPLARLKLLILMYNNPTPHMNTPGVLHYTKLYTEGESLFSKQHPFVLHLKNILHILTFLWEHILQTKCKQPNFTLL